MAPSKSKEVKNIEKKKEGSGHQSEETGTGSSDEEQATQMAEEMRRKVKKRREQRRKRIESEHAKALAAEREISKAKLDEIAKKMIKSHTDRLQRIKELIEKKKAIETNILASSKRIENAYMLANRALQYVLDDRLKGLEVTPRLCLTL